MSRQYWQELFHWIISDGSAIANTTTETILVPNVTIPANFMADARKLRITARGKISNVVTTPGNITFRLRWGGVSGTVLAKSSDVAMSTTAWADAMFEVVLDVTTRANGATGSLLALGACFARNFSTLTREMLGSAGGASGNTPVAVTVDLTADTQLSLTAQFSIANASNSITGMEYYIETLN